jgi:hypothetical protein
VTAAASNPRKRREQVPPTDRLDDVIIRGDDGSVTIRPRPGRTIHITVTVPAPSSSPYIGFACDLAIGSRPSQGTKPPGWRIRG